ncbi:MAG: hypothetical protein ACI9WS_002707 [Paraglaciecola psychrophila]|jgi:hypothetical protein
MRSVVEQGTTIRLARPTDNLRRNCEIYQKGLGFSVLASYDDDQGFDGIVLGNSGDSYHLKFTHHRGTLVGRAPSQDDVIIFYIEDLKLWQHGCNQTESADFKKVASYNPHRDSRGLTYEDVDGYRVVFQNENWTV